MEVKLMIKIYKTIQRAYVSLTKLQREVPESRVYSFHPTFKNLTFIMDDIKDKCNNYEINQETPAEIDLNARLESLKSLNIVVAHLFKISTDETETLKRIVVHLGENQMREELLELHKANTSSIPNRHWLHTGNWGNDKIQEQVKRNIFIDEPITPMEGTGLPEHIRNIIK